MDFENFSIPIFSLQAQIPHAVPSDIHTNLLGRSASNILTQQALSVTFSMAVMVLIHISSLRVTATILLTNGVQIRALSSLLILIPMKLQLLTSGAITL